METHTTRELEMIFFHLENASGKVKVLHVNIFGRVEIDQETVYPWVTTKFFKLKSYLGISLKLII